jgi:hypothetical protein
LDEAAEGLSLPAMRTQRVLDERQGALHLQSLRIPPVDYRRQDPAYHQEALAGLFKF